MDIGYLLILVQSIESRFTYINLINELLLRFSKGNRVCKLPQK